MLAIITPLILVALILAVTLGISFLVVEMTLRMIRRGLGSELALANQIRRPVNSREAYQNREGERAKKTRLQAIAAR